MSDQSGDVTSSADQAEAVTPSDDTVLVRTRGLYIGSAGDVSVRMAKDGNVVVFPSVPAGTVLPVSVTQVMVATTAGSIVRMW